MAIKKVLQDRRYKNRELHITRLLEHPNVVQLKHCFYSTTEKDEVYLNLVLEYVSETVFRVSRQYTRLNQHVPIIYVQLYTYQVKFQVTLLFILFLLISHTLVHRNRFLFLVLAVFCSGFGLLIFYLCHL